MPATRKPTITARWIASPTASIWPSGEAAGDADAVVERRGPGHRLQEERQLLDREERAGEQEEGRDAESEQRVEPGVPALRRGEGHDRGGEGQAGQRGNRNGQHRQGRTHGPEQEDHGEEEAGQQNGPEADPEQIAAQEVGRRHGRVERREVGLVPGELAHDRPGRLERGRHHRLGHQQRRRDVVEIRHSARSPGPVDVQAQAGSHRQQVQERLAQAREQVAVPAPPEHEQVVLEVAQGRMRTRERRRARAVESGGRRAHSTRLRPVSRRKTSSSVLRRTRTLAGWSPRSKAAAAVASPSAV